MLNNVVVGNKVLIVGDLHISDVYKGRHRSYMTTCFKVLDGIAKQVEASNAKTLVLTGDIVGVSERNIKNREVFSVICKWFKTFKDSGVRVIAVRGNHDFGDYPDFQFLVDLGLIETSQTIGGYFDYYGFEGQVVPEVRFHLIDYGMENRQLDILEGETTNIALTHNNFTIQGITNWYQMHDGIELANQGNFAGVYMVINGHIHAPSPEIAFTDAVWGQQIGLFVLGCPTRPAFEKYTSCWYMEFAYSAEEKSTSFNAITFELSSLEDEYNLDEEYLEDKAETEDALAEKQRMQDLQEMFADIMQCRIASGDLTEQIKKIPNASDVAKDTAIKYLQKAMSEL